MTNNKNNRAKYIATLAALGLVASMIGCSYTATAAEATEEAQTVVEAQAETTAGNTGAAADTDAATAYNSTADGEHAITADGETASYSNISVSKTGDSDSGDEADFYGDNAAIFATNGADLTLNDISVSTDGTHANAVFSYGEGTTVTISDSEIDTTGNCSGGLMTTGGGTMNANNLTVHTTGNSSAAIRSDRGGGTVTVNGGSYTTEGTGSPAIYSTADITVNDAELTSTASQGVVVEGKNSVTLNNVTLNADNNTKNSDKSDTYQAVMIYQSMSGDAADGEASFTMNGGTLTNANGDIFFVNNTVATINLSGAAILNADGEGAFLRAEAAGWGNEGSNGGQVTVNAAGQAIEGDMLVDEVSHLNLYLTQGSSFTGAINPDGEAGEVYVELDADSTWTLTADSNISGLTCDADAIDLNGHTLTVNGEAYTEGTESTGTAIEVTVTSGGGSMGNPPEGKPGEGGMGNPPEGKPGEGGPGMGNGETPPEKPDGEKGNPPAKPDESNQKSTATEQTSDAETTTETTAEK